MCDIPLRREEERRGEEADRPFFPHPHLSPSFFGIHFSYPSCILWVWQVMGGGRLTSPGSSSFATFSFSLHLSGDLHTLLLSWAFLDSPTFHAHLPAHLCCSTPCLPPLAAHLPHSLPATPSTATCLSVSCLPACLLLPAQHAHLSQSLLAPYYPQPLPRLHAPACLPAFCTAPPPPPACALHLHSPLPAPHPLPFHFSIYLFPLPHFYITHCCSLPCNSQIFL